MVPMKTSHYIVEVAIDLCFGQKRPKQPLSKIENLEIGQ
jgi:hypothetical protein